MHTITEKQFEDLVDGVVADRNVITKHNPVGSTQEETLLWMLMSCLITYLSLDEVETPCFNGRPDAETYRDAIRFIMGKRKTVDFDVEPYLARLSINDR